MNSIVESIFNEKVTEKWNLWVHKQCINAPLVEIVRLMKKKKKNLKKQQNFHPLSAQSKRPPSLETTNASPLSPFHPQKNRTPAVQTYSKSKRYNF